MKTSTARPAVQSPGVLEKQAPDTIRDWIPLNYYYLFLRMGEGGEEDGLTKKVAITLLETDTGSASTGKRGYREYIYTATETKTNKTLRIRKPQKAPFQRLWYPMPRYAVRLLKVDLSPAALPRNTILHAELEGKGECITNH